MSRGFEVIPALSGQGGKVAQGEVAVDALVQTAKLLETPQGQAPPPGGLGLGRLARHAVHHRLAKEQFGVVRIE